jgi:serine/threonine kinase 38
MNKKGLSPEEQEMIKKEILSQERKLRRESRTKINIRDFIPIKIIGKGAFGEVRLVRAKKTGEVLAMKKMKKSEMVAKHQVQHIKAEKEVLSIAHNPWVVELHYSFQDEKYLYLGMEYLPGGDLMSLLIKKEILSEDESRFYTAEMVR